MPGIILIGNETSRREYLQSFLQEQKIPQYNIRTYDSTLKIGDVRDVIRYVSFKDSKNSHRVVMVNNSITLEAQNALLKTLEELPEDVYIFLSAASSDRFLPTIISRCQIKRVNEMNQEDVLDSQLQQLITSYIDSLMAPTTVLESVLAIGEYVENQDDGFKQVIMAMRSKLRDDALTQEKGVLVGILSTLNSEYSFIEKNNGNSRIVLENILLASSQVQL